MLALSSAIGMMSSAVWKDPDVERYAGPAASPAREPGIPLTQVLYTAFAMSFYGPFSALLQAVPRSAASHPVGDDAEPDPDERAVGDAALLGAVHVLRDRHAARIVRQVPGDVAIQVRGAVHLAQVEALVDRVAHRRSAVQRRHVEVRRSPA